jgi:hypothetical protein
VLITLHIPMVPASQVFDRSLLKRQNHHLKLRLSGWMVSLARCRVKISFIKCLPHVRCVPDGELKFTYRHVGTWYIGPGTFHFSQSSRAHLLQGLCLWGCCLGSGVMGTMMPFCWVPVTAFSGGVKCYHPNFELRFKKVKSFANSLEPLKICILSLLQAPYSFHHMSPNLYCDQWCKVTRA